MTTGERLLDKEAKEIRKAMVDKDLNNQKLADILQSNPSSISQAIGGSGSAALQKLRQRILEVLDLELP